MSEESSPQWRRFAKLAPNRKGLKKRARKIENATLKHAHRFIVRRIDNVRDVRRHALGWLTLAALLILATGFQMYWSQSKYSQQVVAAGGTYAEGVVGKLDTLNPLYASTSAERSASHLIFSSLVDYDLKSKVKSDLALTWKPDAEGKVYTVALRSDAKWHDGEPVTADDVVFTVNLMKNPLARSQQYFDGTWRGISVAKVDAHTVKFTLPSPYAPFPHALTFGVLPEHVLRDIAPSRLRESSFNRAPVGSGPFKFRNLQVLNADQERLVLHMVANEDYYEGKPLLERFQIHTYQDHDQLRKGFLTNEVNAATDLTAGDVDTIKTQVKDVKDASAQLHNGVYGIFRNDSPFLSDVNVRQALVQAVDRHAVFKSIGGQGRLLEGPLVPEHTDAIRGMHQAKYDQKAAEDKLTAAGWVRKGQGVRTKDGQKLQLTVVSRQDGDYPALLSQLAKYWRSVGVDVRTQLVPARTIEGNVLIPRAYDVLLYELELGADPDVYAYWHSSQARPNARNLANYKSGIADDALSSARARSEPQLRDAKYRTFFSQWLQDAPAIALYQPTLHYIASENTRTIPQNTSIPDAVGRYRAVEYWTVNKTTAYTTP